MLNRLQCFGEYIRHVVTGVNVREGYFFSVHFVSNKVVRHSNVFGTSMERLVFGKSCCALIIHVYERLLLLLEIQMFEQHS